METYTAAYNFISELMDAYYWDNINFLDLANATTAKTGVQWDTMTVGELVDEIAAHKAMA